MNTEEEIRQEGYETLLYGIAVAVKAVQDMPENKNECPIDYFIKVFMEHPKSTATKEDIEKWIKDCKSRGMLVEIREGYLQSGV